MYTLTNGKPGSAEEQGRSDHYQFPTPDTVPLEKLQQLGKLKYSLLLSIYLIFFCFVPSTYEFHETLSI